MSDAFGIESHARVLRRSVKSVEAQRFSPSFGVHQGLIPDPNWPPAQFPENNVAMQRRDRRVMCGFMLEFDGQRLQVQGDLSKRGALFLLPTRTQANLVTIELRGFRAQVEVLAVSTRGTQLAHHARFVSAGEGARVWNALISA